MGPFHERRFLIGDGNGVFFNVIEEFQIDHGEDALLGESTISLRTIEGSEVNVTTGGDYIVMLPDGSLHTCQKVDHPDRIQ